MTDVAINRVKTRIRIPANAIREKARVERLVAKAFDQLDASLRQAGISPRGFLCIRELHTIVRIRLHEPDLMLTAKIGHAIAFAIENASSGDSTSAVYYSSRTHALVDLISSAMRADFTRSWAWAQLEIWREGAERSATSTAEQVMRTLVNESRHAIAALSHVARDRFTLIEMFKWATPASWIALSRTLLPDSSSSLDSADDSYFEYSILESIADRIVARSAIADAIVATIRTVPLSTLRALAAFIFLEVEPAIAHTGGAPARALHLAIERNLTRRATPATIPRGAEDREAQPEAATVPDKSGPSATQLLPALVTSQSSVAPMRDESPLAEVRRVASTSAGGLLYLINLATRIGLPGLILGDPRLAHRGLRWSLHQLAITLLALDARDPAALVFAGLLPDAPPPDSNELPPNGDELAALNQYRAAIITALHAAVDDLLNLPDRSDSALIEFVCRRRAQILADPGWIEVHFSLDRVSTEIRRAALDLDPGWVPWLGVVVRFVYA